MNLRNVIIVLAGIFVPIISLVVWRIDARSPQPADPSSFAGEGGAVRGPTGILYTLPKLSDNPMTTLTMESVLAMQGHPLSEAIAVLGEPSRRDPGPGNKPSYVWLSAIAVTPTDTDVARVAHVLIEPDVNGQMAQTVMVIGSLGMLRISRPDWQGLSHFNRQADSAP